MLLPPYFLANVATGGSHPSPTLRSAARSLLLEMVRGAAAVGVPDVDADGAGADGDEVGADADALVVAQLRSTVSCGLAGSASPAAGT